MNIQVWFNRASWFCRFVTWCIQVPLINAGIYNALPVGANRDYKVRLSVFC